MKPLLVVSTCVLVSLTASQLGGCVAAVGAGAAVGATVAYDRRSTGTLIDDQLIELKSLKELGRDRAINDQAHVSATSYNNMVLLTGEAPNEALRTRAGKIIEEIPKVRGVYNELTLAAPSSLLTRSSDSVVTGKVKSSLIRDDKIDAGRIKVVTENGTVFLMGLVTRAEGTRSTEISRRVGGVQRVVKLFEYID